MCLYPADYFWSSGTRTAPLSGDILPGVTRRSILDLARADPGSIGVDVVRGVFLRARGGRGVSRGRLLEASAPAPRPSSAPSARLHQGTSITCPRAATRVRRELALAAPLGRALRARVRLGRATYCGQLRE